MEEKITRVQQAFSDMGKKSAASIRWRLTLESAEPALKALATDLGEQAGRSETDEIHLLFDNP
ncbi:MAG: hypothetical protein JSS49_01515 [Planctomycetes bacterium]|nr:hypothetical protein [Planctomycetota bacterium]